ncbi:type II toxin-antitoxin system prevent-host-death family antitoxin [Azospirillum sp.]|uniref:type II toxin-antitoxin system prevent-host-death family antitoxin n=1 Tax=Azospirillum sp. TaxID=34012 RepID=UPI002D40A33D|nr:type II toxin-antitoxin system prevent-host-death family antitoxin [Azospirillum sp.]HYD66089.1 type II toxin-antitoxin system prevent-host-death family antitoxin [Azospirillum sp.]
MSITAPASEVQKNFGAYHDRALVEPVRVTRYGRETVYIISADAYRSLKQAQRQAIASADLSDDEVKLIEDAEIPAEHRYSLDDLAE